MLNPTKEISTKDRLIFALDVADHQSALALVDELGDTVTFYKLGLEIFMAGNYIKLIEKLHAKDKKIFIDLKFFDVPKTIESAVKNLDKFGAIFATVHGNDAMLQAAVDCNTQTKILAVTALTSLDIKDMEDLGFKTDLPNLVLSRAKRALQLGCAGVISSGLEASKLREELDDKLLIVSPGVRPGYNDENCENINACDDQKRTVTVTEAFVNGADYIVVGRPIRNASKPKIVAQSIQQEILKLFCST